MSKIFSKNTEDEQETESNVDEYIDGDGEDYSACYSGAPNSPSFSPNVAPAQFNQLLKSQLLCLPPSTNSVSVQTTPSDFVAHKAENLSFFYRLDAPFYSEENFQVNQNKETQEKSTSSSNFSRYYDRQIPTPGKGSQLSSSRSTPTKTEIQVSTNAYSENSRSWDWFNWRIIEAAGFVLLLVFVSVLLMDHFESVRTELIEKQMLVINECESNFYINECNKPIGPMVDLCNNWRKCKEADPQIKISTFKVITTGLATTLNSFFEELSMKTTICVLLLAM